MESVLGERGSESEDTKDLLKEQWAINKKNTEFLVGYQEKAGEFREFVEKINELSELTEQIPASKEEHQGKLFNEGLVKMIELMEGAIKSKEEETRCLKEGYNTRITDLTQKNREVTDKKKKVKEMRVEFQKGIRELEKKLNAMKIDPDEPVGPIPADAEQVNPNEKKEEAQSKADGILSNLANKLEFMQTGENEEQHFLRNLQI